MACACGKKASSRTTYLWRGNDGSTKVYKTEQEARWKVQRDGGSYTAKS